MSRLLLVGTLDDTRPLLDLLPDGDYAVTLAPHADAVADLLLLGDASRLILVALDSGTLERSGGWADADGRRIPWIGWNVRDDQTLSVNAYERGALAVLPGHLTRDALGGALRTAFARAHGDARAPGARAGHGAGRYSRGARIALDERDVLVVEHGIVATAVLHGDGSEALVGLTGAGDVIVGHPHDSCCLQLYAHTDARVVVQPWAHAAATPRFKVSERLRLRLRRVEAWAAVQARPHLDDRVTGLLSLLAEQFGEPGDGGMRVDVRLTHQQLAAATGTTRATLTRIVGRLRRQQVLHTEGEGADERFVLRVVERHAHG
jgi:hypothetical protein